MRSTIMKNKYISPKIEIIEINNDDIIRTSTGTDDDWTNLDNLTNINEGKWSPFK